MTNTIVTIADTAGINGWVAQYSGPRTNNGLDSVATYTRSGVRVHVRFTIAGSVASATRSGERFGEYGVSMGHVSGRDSGKRATVLQWLAAQPDTRTYCERHGHEFNYTGTECVRTSCSYTQPVRFATRKPAVSDTLRMRAAAASVLLSRAIDSLAADTVAATGIAYAPMADAPDSFDALLNEYSVATMTRVLPVWDGASDATVYDGADTNYAFRYWHDMGHVQFDCDFTPAGETALQLQYHTQAVAGKLAVLYPNSGHAALLALRLYIADTIGQIEYSVRHGAFATDQREFCLAYVTDPAAAVAATY